MDIQRIISQASNVKGGANPPFTISDFQKRYPQFFETGKAAAKAKPLVPQEIIDDIIQLAHSSVKKSRFRGSWEMCMGYFIAHFITLYMQTTTNAPNGAAAAGATKGLLTSKSVDGVSVSYDFSQTLGDLNGWAGWKTTSYGVQYATMAKMYGMGGMYVP